MDMGKIGRDVVVWLIGVIIMVITTSIIDRLNDKKKQAMTAREEQDREKQEQGIYTVKVPEILIGMFQFWIGLGIVMFITFSIFKLKNNPTVTDGHIHIAIFAISVGVIGTILSKRWRIEVNGSEMVIHRLFRPKIKVHMSEIERAEIGKKGEMRLYAHGKKITTVDLLCIGRAALRRDLEKYGKVTII